MRPNQPSSVHVVVVAVGVGIVDLREPREWPGGSSPSKQPPNQPGYLHDEVDAEEVGECEVVVTEGAGAGLAFVVVIVDVSSSGSLSLQPNQPGVLQVDVDEVDVVLIVVVALPVVDSSRQPHHPGVLQVSVRVRELRVSVELEVGLDFEDEEVVVSVPLLSKYSQG
jgi:hypothetical protein